MSSETTTPKLSFPAGDVVKQGFLFMKRPPRKYLNRIRAWHKRYFVLRDETEERGPRVEMYEKDEFSPTGLSGPKIVLDLAKCVHIGYTSDSTRFSYALVIVCAGRSPMMLAAEDEQGARSWLLALGLITHKNSASASFARDIYTVTIHPTEASERLHLSGEVQLVIFSNGVGLAKNNTSDCFVMWPMCYMRQFRLENISSATAGTSKSKVITLDIGRRATSGEGIFQFRSERSEAIIRELKSILDLHCAMSVESPFDHSSSSTDLVTRSSFTCQPSTSTGRTGYHRCHRSPVVPPLPLSRQSSPMRLPGPSSGAIPKVPSSTRQSSSQRRTTASDSEVNYIVPLFEDDSDNEDEDEEDLPGSSSSKSIVGKVLKRDKRRRVVTTTVMKDGCVKSKQTRILGAQKHSTDGVRAGPSNSSDGEENCYVEIIRGSDNEITIHEPALSSSRSHESNK